jgi:ketosteroid isomerase-like protein
MMLETQSQPPDEDAAMRRYFAVAATLVIAISCLVSTGSAQTQPVRAEVVSFVKKYVETINAGDVTTLMDMVSRRPEVNSINDGEITRGWEAIRADADEIVGKEGSYRLSVGSIDVATVGSAAAIAIAPYTIIVATQQGTVQMQGALTFVVEKRVGKWTLLHEHYSSKPAAQ